MRQIIAMLVTNGYISGMDKESNNTMLDALERYLARKGHGHVEETAKALGVSRQHLARIRKEESAAVSFYYKLEEFLKKEGYWEDSMNEVASVAEGPAGYDDVPPRLLIARDLLNLSQTLANTEYSDEFVARKLAAWIKVSYEGLPDLVKAIEKGGNRGDDV